MKNLIFITLGFLVIFFLAVGLILYLPFPGPFDKGPKAHYRVEEGVVEVFGARNGQIQSLLGAVTAGGTLTAPTLSASAEKVPFWLSWIEPVMADAVGRARYYMYKEGKKTKKREFTVEYTNETIRTKGFVRELERSKLLKNIQIDFFPDGFSFYAKALGIPITARGTSGTAEGAGDKLFFRFKWLKVGSFSMPEHVLRGIENLAAKAYVQSGQFSTKLTRIIFAQGRVTMSFQKTSDMDIDFLK